jgi:hypothetical protein
MSFEPKICHQREHRIDCMVIFVELAKNGGGGLSSRRDMPQRERVHGSGIGCSAVERELAWRARQEVNEEKGRRGA